MSAPDRSSLPRHDPLADAQAPLPPRPAIHALLAEFDDELALLDAVRAARAAGYRQLEAFSPFPVEGLFEALGERSHHRLNIIVVIVMLLGAAFIFWLQYYATAVDYPLNVGGRPLNSWPAYLPVTFQVMMLVAAVTAFVGMLLLTGLPAQHRLLRHAPDFDLASRDRFFLAIMAEDPQFHPERARRFLESLGPLEVYPLAL
ncbi:MAG: DUF3341 domain-containing protein [Candidatus Promineifilaceae bacterium]|nr:DUF3341 domain-containing protein [Candidatus Promineifilaceae bacterium]